MKLLGVLCALCVLSFQAFALDREAFTSTKYDLDVRVEPEQQHLAVRGKITLRNDSAIAQKNLALQISSSLNWQAVRVGGEPAQFESHQYTSDIDHTGALSEAVVTLAREVPPKGSIELDIGYEGVIPLDATRLTRIGVPADKAKHSDWDQIGKSFSAVRGIGYVAWYPIATEAASLSEGNSVEEAVGRWIAKHTQTEFSVKLSYLYGNSDQPLALYCNGQQTDSSQQIKQEQLSVANCSWSPLALAVPTLVIANYQTLTVKDRAQVYFLIGQQDAAESYADAASKIDPVRLGKSSANLQIFGLADEDDAPFVTQGIFLTPFRSPMTNQTELDIVYALARQSAPSARPWIQEGLAHYSQVSLIEAQRGRQAALDYLEAHKSILLEGEKQAGDKSDWSLVTAPDDLFLQTKSMYIWWMLKDMTGNALTDALLGYDTSRGEEATFMQKLIEKKSSRDLQWFFDDWVYHDRRLPDFRVASVFSTPVESGGFLVTILVENLGSAGAEVPIILQTESTEIRKRLEVHGKSKASIRIQTQSAPKEVTVNDGSVPESDVDNNTYTVQTPQE